MCGFGSLNEFFALTNSEIAISVLGILTLLVPVILLLYVLICLFMSRRPNRTASIVMFIIWLLIFFTLCIVAIKSVYQVHSHNDFENFGNAIELIEEASENRIEQIEDATEAVEEAVEEAIENNGSVTITTPDGTKISVFDIEKSGGTFRKTQINIDK